MDGIWMTEQITGLTQLLGKLHIPRFICISFKQTRDRDNQPVGEMTVELIIERFTS